MAREMKNSGIEWIGEIPVEWDITKCKYISDFINGYAFDSKQLEIDFYYPVIRIGDIVNSKVDFLNCQGIKSNRDLDKYKILNNDILLAMSGATVGKVGVANNPPCAYINQRVGIIRSPYYKYLFYCLCTDKFVEHILLEASGSAQPNVSGSVYGDFKIPFPTDEIRNSIEKFLDQKCAEIDAVTEKTKATIEEYKKLKQSVITEAITKGIRGNRPMKDSGIDWIGEIPAEWNIQKGKWILKRLERPVQSTDEVITCFRDGEVTLRSNRREDGFTFSLQEAGYQGIEPGDLVVHGMDGFAGAIGISNSRGKATPVLNVMDCTENKRYIMYYLRNMAYNGIFIALATGIRVRSCDTNWNKLKELPYLIPSIEEQKEISDFIDIRLSELDNIITKKTNLLTELETYKKSLIYEYITGKKEVGEVSDTTTVAIVYPYFPAVLSTDRARFAQAVLMSKILDSNVKYMGRVKLEKMLFTIEHSIGFDFDTDYARQKAGPLDGSIYECEKIVSRTNKWFYVNKSQYGTSYKPQKNMGKYKRYYEQYFSDYNEEIESIISVFENYSLDQSEIVATLFAAWNDAIIDNKPFTDEDVVNDVLNNWHESKTRFSKDMWLRAMDGMRKNNLVPKGYGKKTVIKDFL